MQLHTFTCTETHNAHCPLLQASKPGNHNDLSESDKDSSSSQLEGSDPTPSPGAAMLTRLRCVRCTFYPVLFQGFVCVHVCVGNSKVMCHVCMSLHARRHCLPLKQAPFDKDARHLLLICAFREKKTNNEESPAPASSPPPTPGAVMLEKLK
jgi:hypothetical protein